MSPLPRGASHLRLQLSKVLSANKVPTPPSLRLMTEDIEKCQVSSVKWLDITGTAITLQSYKSISALLLIHDKLVFNFDSPQTLKP